MAETGALEDLRDGERVFVDAPVFIYHFTGASTSCRELLARCERGELRGVTSVTVLAEATHRLMLLEALAEGIVARPNVVQKLRAAPDRVRRLRRYHEQVAAIPLMGIEVLAIDLALLLEAQRLRERHGLMTNASLIAASARVAGVEALASADGDFAGIDGLRLYRPADLA